MSCRAIRFAIVALFLAPLASAGSPDAPELADDAGDCALPYAAGYLDVVAAWIEAEDAQRFDVVMELAAFDETLAEGAAYAVQFEHQGVRWGTLATFRPVSDAGWSFFTGVVDTQLVEPDTLTPREGSFSDVGAPTIRVSFPKSIFPHVDPDDRALRSFFAGTADLRTAYPFLLATDQVAAGSSNGKWLICDTAESDATYAFKMGSHSAEHGEHAVAPAAPAPDAEVAAEGAAPLAPEEATPAGTRDVPMPAWLALVALAFSRVARSRGR